MLLRLLVVILLLILSVETSATSVFSVLAVAHLFRVIVLARLRIVVTRMFLVVVVSLGLPARLIATLIFGSLRS